MPHSLSSPTIQQETGIWAQVEKAVERPLYEVLQQGQSWRIKISVRCPVLGKEQFLWSSELEEEEAWVSFINHYICTAQHCPSPEQVQRKCVLMVE